VRLLRHDPGSPSDRAPTGYPPGDLIFGTATG